MTPKLSTVLHNWVLVTVTCFPKNLLLKLHGESGPSTYEYLEANVLVSGYCSHKHYFNFMLLHLPFVSCRSA